MSKEDSRNTRGLKSVAIFFAAIIYGGAVIYGDIQFLSIMSASFSTGILKALSIFGAIMVGASALILPVALHFWFSPGTQFIGGIVFWLVDIVVLGLNSILAYSVYISDGSIDPWLQVWYDLSPATPTLAVIGWGVMFLLDESHARRHAEAERQAELDRIWDEQEKKAQQSEEVYGIIREGAEIKARKRAGLLAHGSDWSSLPFVGNSGKANGAGNGRPIFRPISPPPSSEDLNPSKR